MIQIQAPDPDSGLGLKHRKGIQTGAQNSFEDLGSISRIRVQALMG